jgi:hypothetical protein
MFILRWLDAVPEKFLHGDVQDVGTSRLPKAGTQYRLRWDLAQVYAALNKYRIDHECTWNELSNELEFTPSRLTNLKSARLADMTLVMRVTQLLGRPAVDFIHRASW